MESEPESGKTLRKDSASRYQKVPRAFRASHKKIIAINIRLHQLIIHMTGDLDRLFRIRFEQVKKAVKPLPKDMATVFSLITYAIVIYSQITGKELAEAYFEVMEIMQEVAEQEWNI